MWCMVVSEVESQVATRTLSNTASVITLHQPACPSCAARVDTPLLQCDPGSLTCFLVCLCMLPRRPTTGLPWWLRW